MKDIEILEFGKPIPDYKDQLAKGLHAYNVSVIGEHGDSEKITGFAKSKSGAILGGIYGELGWGWLHIHWLWCSESVRRGGVGSELLKGLEEYASKHGVNKYRLETTEFQALEFYMKNGYVIFGELDDLPPGYKSYFLKKEV